MIFLYSAVLSRLQKRWYQCSLADEHKDVFARDLKTLSKLLFRSWMGQERVGMG